MSTKPKETKESTFIKETIDFKLSDAEQQRRLVNDARKKRQELMDITEQCLLNAIQQAIPGNRIGDISHAVQTQAESHGYGVVRELVGHGIGTKLHEEPQIPNFGSPGTPGGLPGIS